MTDVKIVRCQVESAAVYRIGNAVNTFQMNFFNNTGGAFTPTIQSKYANAGIDSWGSTVIDLAATPMSGSTCAAAAACTDAYSLLVTAATFNGYEYNIDLGNNFSSTGKNVKIGWFDARVTPGVATGINVNPPPMEMRDPGSDVTWNQRFYQATYDNGVAPGAATHVGMVGTTGATSSNSGQMGNSFRTTMRCDPSVSFWDGAGNANKQSFWNGAAWTDNQAVAPVVLNAGQNGFAFYNNLAGTNESFHYAADCTITGG